MDQYSMCKIVNHPEFIVQFGQQIKTTLTQDMYRYDCYNRGDENPYLRTKSNNSGNDDRKNWVEWVNTPCEYNDWRRCLGSRPDFCVEAWQSK